MGREIRVKIVKNKVAPPFRSAQFDIMFGEGISRSGEILDLAVDYDFIKKSGAWFSYKGKKLGQGRDAVKKVVENDKEMQAELIPKIMEALKTIGPKKKSKKDKSDKKTEEIEQPEYEDYTPEPEETNEDPFGDDLELEV